MVFDIANFLNSKLNPHRKMDDLIKAINTMIGVIEHVESNDTLRTSTIGHLETLRAHIQDYQKKHTVSIFSLENHLAAARYKGSQDDLSRDYVSGSDQADRFINLLNGIFTEGRPVPPPRPRDPPFVEVDPLPALPRGSIDTQLRALDLKGGGHKQSFDSGTDPDRHTHPAELRGSSFDGQTFTGITGDPGPIDEVARASMDESVSELLRSSIDRPEPATDLEIWEALIKRFSTEPSTQSTGGISRRRVIPSPSSGLTGSSDPDSPVISISEAIPIRPSQDSEVREANAAIYAANDQRT